MWVRSLADCDASCGGKAHGLAKLLAAGLRVPDGFVIVPEAFRVVSGLGVVALDDIGHELAKAGKRLRDAELPIDLVDEVTAAANVLGDSFAVRSSSTIEDGEAGTGAGVFYSSTNVPTARLWPTIRAVWWSALTTTAATYARWRNASPAIAVIVQRFVDGDRAVIYTRPPGDPAGDQMWIQRRERMRFAGVVFEPSASDWVRPSTLEKLPRSQFAATIERVVDTPRGADIELVVPEGAALDDAWIVQARPIVHSTTQPRVPPPATILAVLDDGRRWTWDIAHNPDPLSPAQVGLVERIERAEIAPYALRVCGGYLYSAPLDATKDRPPLRDASTTDARLNERVAEIEARLDRVLDGADGTLADAIDRYVGFYELWTNELSPLARAQPHTAGGARPSAVELTLLAASRDEIDEAMVFDRVGVLAPAWDVSVPTYGERSWLVRNAIKQARGVRKTRDFIARQRRRRQAAVDDDGAAINTDADLRERDDVWFARAQWMVRKAILAKADALGIVADDAFWIPLDELVSATELDATAVARRASAQRAAAERAAQWAMPVVVGGDEPVCGEPLHGIGTGPPVTGRVVRYSSLATAIAASPGDVVVTRAITPALALLVVGCAAIVSETGGLLDHGAAIARELGITCVVGCRDAWTLLSDGMIVVVDGDRGLVTS